MAQTKRKRQSKHRGNAAGAIESRGRTGRRPTAAEKSGQGQAKAKAREKRMEKYDKPPTWRGAFYRALAAAVLMVIISLVLTHKTVEAFLLFPVVLAAYVPISYYTDHWLYRRRLREKAKLANRSASR
jgi:Flp pilus assembly protein TadB